MRGKEGDELGLGQTIRITPAYAGKREARTGRDTRHGDHPRACGEKVDVVKLANGAKGSPPRVRGKVFGVALCIDFLRITPAYAGKRLRCRTNCC